MEGIPYRTIAKNLGVNYRNVYDWINNYRKYSLDGIRNKRKYGGRKPVISTHKNKEMIKDIVLNKSPKTFGYLKNTWSIRLLATYLSHHYWKWMSVQCKHEENNSWFRHSIQKQPKLELEKGRWWLWGKERKDRQIQESIICSF